MKKKKWKILKKCRWTHERICFSCGGKAWASRQWPAREKGQSICIGCVALHPKAYSKETIGVPGVHWGLDDPQLAQFAVRDNELFKEIS